jgi:hypothetical protein
MLTNVDINKLKKIFVTKKELRKAVEEQTAIIVGEIKTVLEIVGEMSTKLDGTIKVINGHTVSIGGHEERIQKIEDKVFPQL